MTPTVGWILALVALAAVAGLVVSVRRLSALKTHTPPPKEDVAVTMTCDANDFTLKVDPWHVHVKKGRPLRWKLNGPSGSTMTIEPQVPDPNDWPFTGQPAPSQAAPGVTIATGNVKSGATTGSTHKYSIVLKCDGRTFDIDPDIYILDP